MKTLSVIPVLAVLVACGGGSGDTSVADGAPPADPGVVADDAGLPSRGPAPTGCEYMETFCRRMNDCAPLILSLQFGTVAKCTERMNLWCTDAAQVAGSGLTSTTARACATALDSHSCSDLLGNGLAACSFIGSRPDGAVCGANPQCASGLCVRSGQACGTCQPRGPAGTPCRKSVNDDCQTGLVCANSGQCVEPAKAGEKCDATSKPCLARLYCTKSGTCAIPGKAGDACAESDGCDILAGVICGPNKICVQVKTATAGQSCGLNPKNGDGPTVCAPGAGNLQTCKATTGTISLGGLAVDGICTAPALDGDGCTNSNDCLPPAECTSGRCTLPVSGACQ
jgi:hypothetical protein